MGATVLDSGGVRFRVWAQDAERVEVELYEGEPVTRVPLDPAEDATWCGVVRAAGHATRYRFRLNGNGSFPDPYARSQPEGVHGPSEVIDPSAFEWHDQAWHGAG